MRLDWQDNIHNVQLRYFLRHVDWHGLEDEIERRRALIDQEVDDMMPISPTAVNTPCPSGDVL